MLRFNHFTLCLAVASLPAVAETVSSPDGKVVVDVNAVDGVPTYSVSYDGRPFVHPSPLGVVTDGGDFSKGLVLSAASPVEAVSESYTMPNTKKSDIKVNANRAVYSFTKDGKKVTVKRMLEDGYMTIETQTPCLLTCIKELNTPRYMSVGGIFECYSKPVDVYDYNTLKDDPLIDPATIGLKGSPTNIFKSFTPPQKGQGRMLDGADRATCDELAAELLKKHII